MWEQVQPVELPYELPEATTSVWLHQPTNSYAGVMRFGLLSPPFLWFKLGTYDITAIKLARQQTDELQLLINEPRVFAEPEPTNLKAQRFLQFVGFVPHEAPNGVRLFERNL